VRKCSGCIEAAYAASEVRRPGQGFAQQSPGSKNTGGFYNTMELQVYISQLKDEAFDYNIECPIGNIQYAPKAIYWGYRLDELYKDIVHKVINHDENTKQTDWGTFVIKFAKTDLMEYLLKYVIMYEKNLKEMSEGTFKEIYKEHNLGRVNSLLNQTKKLPDGEYLLVAQELF
jgi:hypothetical protein